MNAPEAKLVLCFEVLIHQETLRAYLTFIEYLAGKNREDFARFGLRGRN
jgi:hypothetical protein